MARTDLYWDLQRQGFMRAAAKRQAAEERQQAKRAVSDAQFRENIRRDVARRTRIMFGEEEA